MYQAVSLVAWMLAMPLIVESAVPEPELDISKKHCEQVEGDVFCKGPNDIQSRSYCFYSYCDAVAAGYTQCRQRKPDEVCGKPQ